MDKNDFKADTRYTITWQRPGGRATPANIYVHRVYDGFMVARVAGEESRLRKIAYPEVLKLVAAEAVASAALRPVPAALLDEKTWKNRDEMEHYSSSPQLGK